jgi:hypothetical protein
MMKVTSGIFFSSLKRKWKFCVSSQAGISSLNLKTLLADFLAMAVLHEGNKEVSTASK